MRDKETGRRAMARITGSISMAAGLVLAASLWPAAVWAATTATADEQTEMAMAVAGLPLRFIEAATVADRHIVIGLTLLAFSLMAATTFSLWRWQMRGLAAEAYHRGA